MNKYACTFKEFVLTPSDNNNVPGNYKWTTTSKQAREKMPCVGLDKQQWRR